jgi:glucose/arabinose dehydrogenase
VRHWSIAGLGLAAVAGAAAVAACSAGTTQTTVPPSSSPTPTASTSPAPTTDPRIHLAPGFVSSTIASIAGARELVALPNGDLVAGTDGSQLYLVPNAESAGAAGTPHVFITLPDKPADGVALSTDGATIFASTEYDVFSIGYHTGDQSEPNSDAVQIGSVRTGPVSPGSDGDIHITTSVVATSTTLYAGVGSSCNACVEVDPTRASIQAMNLDGSGMHTLATRIRNPIALAIDPATGVLWAGGAGQDDLPYTHPFEYVDAVTLQPGAPVDYGWPDCEEDRIPYKPGSDCSSVAIPRVEFPAYSTHIGAVFYPTGGSGAYAFPSAYRGSLFVTSHGSWHCCPSTPPDVASVAMNGDVPKIAVNWNDPTAQSDAFMWNFGTSANTSYIGRPTGVAVGSQGSLFVADDQNGVIYRIRPAGAGAHPRAAQSSRPHRTQRETGRRLP